MKNKKLLVIVALFVVACLALTFAACTPDNPDGPNGDKPTQLAAPVISINQQTGEVSWKKVEHADSYDVIVNTNPAINVTVLKYTFPSDTPAGDYQVKVIAKSTDTAKYLASKESNVETYHKQGSLPGGATLTSLTMIHEPDKMDYFLDERAEEIDLTGAQFLARYSDNSSKTVYPQDVKVDDYTMTEGDFDVTVKYTDNDVTQSCIVTFTLRERTDADIDVNGVEFIYNNVADENYVVANREASVVANMRGEALTVSASEGKTTVPAAELKEGRNLLSVTYADEQVELVIVVVGRVIESVDDFKAMAQDVTNGDSNHYYLLARDIDFDNTWQNPIGAAPLAVSIVQGDEGPTNAYTPDPVNGAKGTGEATDETVNQQGVPFEGTLDGLGHTIMNYKIGREAAYKIDAYGIAMFGWLAENATICNLNLRNVSMQGGKHVAILVGVNSGTIENVSIEETCRVQANYTLGAAFVGYNFGTVKNVVSLMETYVTNWGDRTIVLAFSQATDEEDTTVKNGFIGNADHSATLGSGWRYFEGVGTLYVTPSFVRINSTNGNLVIGRELELDVIIQEGDPSNVEVNFFGPHASLLSYEWRLGKLYVSVQNPSESGLVGGESVNMTVSGAGTVAVFTITIAAAEVDHYELTSDENISITEGLDIELSSINISKVMTDGSSSTIHPTRLEGYDKNGQVGVQQNVKAFYGQGDNDYVTLKVTLLQKQVVSIEMSSQPTKNSYTIDEDTVLSLDGAKILVKYNNNTQEILPVEMAWIDASSYNLAVAASYNVKVSYGGHDCTFSITVMEAGAKVVSIAIVGAPAKTVYKIGESVTTADLVGATITATMSKGEPTTGIAITDAMISYNFKAAGSAQITVTYEQQQATIDVTVVDYATALVITPKDQTNSIPQIAYSKATALDLISAADFSLTMKSGASVSVSDPGSKISADNSVEAGLRTITYTYTDEYATVSASQQFEIWYEVNAANKEEAMQEWTFMQSNLYGYYRLTSSMDFNAQTITPLGQQGYDTVNGGSEYDPDKVGKGDGSKLQVATPFMGKFDGQGWQIRRFKIGTDVWEADGFGTSPFGHIGKGAVVENVIIRQAEYNAKRFGIVASVNEGTIRNVLIDETNTFTQTFGNENVRLVLINMADGVIDNVVSYATTGTNKVGTTNKTPVVETLQFNRADASAVTDCFIIDRTEANDASQWANLEGWSVVEGYGPAFGHYVFVVPTLSVHIDDKDAADATGALVKIRIYYGANTSYNFDYFNVWSDLNVGLYPKKVADGDGYRDYTVTLTEKFTSGNSYSAGARVDGKYYTFTFAITQEGL